MKSPEPIGVDARLPAVPTPPGRGLALGVTRDGLVALNYSERVQHLTLTPDQAHDLGRALMKHAKMARRVRR